MEIGMVLKAGLGQERGDWYDRFMLVECHEGHDGVWWTKNPEKPTTTTT